MNTAVLEGYWEPDSYSRWEDDNPKFSDLVGMTLAAIQVVENHTQLRMVTTEGRKFMLYHSQDCCEYVYLEDICGDLDDLIGSPIVEAEEATNRNGTWDDSDLAAQQCAQALITSESLDDRDESYTWTFYKLATAKGFVTLRWLGESNGYYSESVDFIEIVDMPQDSNRRSIY